MKYTVKVKSIRSIDQIEGSWNNNDLKELLKRFDYPDADKIAEDEIMDYLNMAIADFDPNEAAAIVLDYKLAGILTEGQIHNLSNDMLREKVSENYTEIDIHKSLFAVNQLLYKAYNGKFPPVKANLVEFEIIPDQEDIQDITKELVLKAFSVSLSDNNLVNRLFSDQLAGILPFAEAEGIVWELHSKGNDQFSMITSEKWLDKEDFTKMEFECVVTNYEEEAKTE
jgi:hypothetical protein